MKKATKKKSVKPAKKTAAKKTATPKTHADCAFCQILKGEKNAYIICEFTEAICILSRRPRTNGQCFIIPRKHYTTLSDIPAQELQKLFLISRDVSTDLQKKLNARGVDMLYTSGESDFPSVNHVAIHLFPRFEKDNLNVWPKLDTTQDKD